MKLLKLKIVGVLVSLTYFRQFTCIYSRMKTKRARCRDSRHPGLKHEMD